MATWVEMFASQALVVDSTVETELRGRIDYHARTRGLFADDQWIADYVRLRFVAIAR